MTLASLVHKSARNTMRAKDLYLERPFQVPTPISHRLSVRLVQACTRGQESVKSVYSNFYFNLLSQALMSHGLIVRHVQGCTRHYKSVNFGLKFPSQMSVSICKCFPSSIIACVAFRTRTERAKISFTRVDGD